MTVFDVFVNDRKLCRAGVGRDGVLDAIITWVTLAGDAARTARKLKQPLEETRLLVGGLSRDTHVRWPGRMLITGDRVTIAVANANAWDPPVYRKRESARQQQLQERRYYLRLKKKYEPRRKSARGTTDSNTRFLNVDLDLWSAASLDPLVKAFGRTVLVLYSGKEGRRYSAHLELATPLADADRVIRRFVRLVERLPRTARTLWNRAQTREFNIGVQAEATPLRYDLQLKPETVLAMARVHARLGVTVYGADAT